VPGEYAASCQVGANYSEHVVGSGPYSLTTYVPGQTVILDRNPNWDPATDPLRKAWVDRIQIKLDVGISSIQQQIEHQDADLSLGQPRPPGAGRRAPGRSRAVPAAGGHPHREHAVPGP
jgi:peptide/nickel transport system substrate-binding protein